MEPVSGERNSRNKKEKKKIGNNQNRFTKGEWCLTDFVTFCDDMTICIVHKKEVAELIYLDFRKAYDTISCKVLKTKLGLGRQGRENCPLCERAAGICGTLPGDE